MAVEKFENEDWAYGYVMRFIEDRFGIPREKISPTDRLADLGMDSLEHVEFVMGLEDELKVEVPEELGPVDTVADMIELVRRLR